MPRSEAAQIPQYRHEHQYRPGYRPMGGGPPVRKYFFCILNDFSSGLPSKSSTTSEWPSARLWPFASYSPNASEFTDVSRSKVKLSTSKTDQSTSQTPSPTK